MAFPQVVRVFATSQEPDYDCPWQAQRPTNSTGSGVLIAPNQILTGAHVVANTTFLQVQKISDPNKAIAQVISVCHDCDLALLEVEDPHFAADIEPAPIGDLPGLRDRVSVVGFPIGGEEISITEGVVSRIEVQRYRHSRRHLLAVTVDAAINEGNSGGPVFQDNQVAGIAFQKLNKADNIGELVPTPLIRNFLDAIKKNKPPHVPSLSITTQTIENPQLRSKTGLTGSDAGVLVTSVEYGGSAWGYLQPRDVLLRIGGHPIANNGTIIYRNRFRTRYDVVLCDFHIGDMVQLEILRKGQKLTLELPLKTAQHLVPRNEYDALPTYFIYGGLVFQPLSQNFINTWNRWREAPAEFLHYFDFGVRTEDCQEIIVLTQVLCDALNVGYEDLYDESVIELNGKRPANMLDFVRTIEAAQSEIEITVSSGGIIVLHPQQVQAAHSRILQHYHILHDRSPNLRTHPTHELDPD